MYRGKLQYGCYESNCSKSNKALVKTKASFNLHVENFEFEIHKPILYT